MTTEEEQTLAWADKIEETLSVMTPSENEETILVLADALRKAEATLEVVRNDREKWWHKCAGLEAENARMRVALNQAKAELNYGCRQCFTASITIDAALPSAGKEPKK